MENPKTETEPHRETTNQNASDNLHTGINKVTQAKLAGYGEHKSHIGS